MKYILILATLLFSFSLFSAESNDWSLIKWQFTCLLDKACAGIDKTQTDRERIVDFIEANLKDNQTKDIIYIITEMEAEINNLKKEQRFDEREYLKIEDMIQKRLMP